MQELMYQADPHSKAAVEASMRPDDFVKLQNGTQTE